MKSHGFTVLYFPYDTIIAAFRRVGINAKFDESTADAQFAQRVSAWEALSNRQRQRVAQGLVKINSDAIKEFLEALGAAITRKIETVRILALHGKTVQWTSIDQAIAYIESYDEDDEGSKPVAKYEILIRYSNGDRIEAQFADKARSIQFLRSYQPPRLQPAPQTGPPS